MTTYKTYRTGAGPIAARIKAAVSHFYRHRQMLPVAIAVSPAEVDAAREACAALALPVPVTVTVNGGCLVGEVWLAEEVR